ncbi:hypothetical protein CAOG_03091 [Capsaspora owczarzaki ATCC 30864]|uniref:Cytochrome P450 n=1 Tax=Capsaspora owczarzaki (strain ATCC 30864) TaxID=595528 RepID=A0A0D2X274_CAPO3|nr:hypothetical protein CAOG_03091 [Capsaspora owczarzaki ATCC 30864]KJE92064.1 hypothetical protein CAOG_003091 [Capsaspora owczarzaki ATCC 30864]|eukprot:XP_004363930.1 hypothetical protein CAOG_03091 [Capsaspora owczarzaki ATCC 30864]
MIAIVTEASSWSLVLTAVVVLATSYILYYVWLYPTYISTLRHLPGPKGHWLTGNMSDIFNEEPAAPHLRWAKQYGSYSTYRVFLSERLLIADPEGIRHVLSAHPSRYARPLLATNLLKRVIGHALLTAEGKEHERMRRMLTPAFHHSKLKNFVELFRLSAQRLEQNWMGNIENAEANNKELAVDATSKVAGAKPLVVPGDSALVNAHVDFSKLTMDVIGHSAFGYAFKSQESGDRAMFDLFSDLLAVGRFTWKQLVPFAKYLPFPENIAFKKAVKTADGIVDKVIADKWQQREQQKSKQQQLVNDDSNNNNNDEEEEDDLDTKAASRKRDLLDLLMDVRDEETQAAISDQELRDQVKTFMLAGHETTSVAMSWILYALAQHPDVQDRLRSELEDFDVEHMTWESLEKLSYLSAVISEAMRRYPPVPITNRVAMQDDVIGNVQVRKGMTIMILPGMMHLHPALWDNPDEFRPARFLSEEQGGTGEAAKVNRFVYMPFLHGPRMCIGHKFATMEMKAVIATIVRRFYFFMPENSPEYVRRLTVTMRPFPDLKLGIRLVQG